MNLYPPNPVLISESVLKQLDASPPGTFYAQKKLDGRRRIVTREADGSYTWLAKSKSAEDTFAIVAPLQTAFESLDWPCGTTLDVEYTGLRTKDGTPELYVFDLLAQNGAWSSLCFKERIQTLNLLAFGRVSFNGFAGIHIVPVLSNPTMTMYYESLKSDPLCEGVVIRAADQVNVGTRERCRDGQGIFKCRYSDNGGR